MSLYRSTAPMMVHPVHRDSDGCWIRTNVSPDIVTTIKEDDIVLKIDKGNLKFPYISSITNSISTYHICIYGEQIVGIYEDKWNRYFIPIETKTE